MYVVAISPISSFIAVIFISVAEPKLNSRVKEPPSTVSVLIIFVLYLTQLVVNVTLSP